MRTTSGGRWHGFRLLHRCFRGCRFGHGLARRAWHYAGPQLGHIMWAVDGQQGQQGTGGLGEALPAGRPPFAESDGEPQWVGR